MNKFLFLFFTLISLVFYSDNAHADTEGPDILTKVICNIVVKASGPVAQGIATLVIIITGYSFFVGKVSIGMLFIVAGGVMFVFGSQTIVGWIIGDSAYKCTGGNVGGDVASKT